MAGIVGDNSNNGRKTEMAGIVGDNSNNGRKDNSNNGRKLFYVKSIPLERDVSMWLKSL